MFSSLANEEEREGAFIEDILDVDKIALEQIQEGEERVEELTDDNEKINEKNDENEMNNKIVESEKNYLLDSDISISEHDSNINGKDQAMDNEKELIKQIQKAECIAETFENVKIFPILGVYMYEFICAYEYMRVFIHLNV
jgi:hypothetical protein